MLGGPANLSARPAPRGADAIPTLDALAPGLMRLAQAAAQGGTQAPAAAAPDAAAPAPAASDEPIGNVATLTGIATVIRNKDSIALKLRDDIYLNDIVQTSASSSLSPRKKATSSVRGSSAPGSM